MMPAIIAHRGASAYLPEHTLAAKTLAYAMAADYLEQDVVASRDDVLVVLHDVHLDRVTNVAEVYPDRARDDGRYYVRDFDFAELRELSVWERFGEDGNAVYAGRYPARSGRFGIHSLREEFELVAQLNAVNGTNTGIYPEIKRPAWHREEGVDISPSLLNLLKEFGYRDKTSPVFVQCFDAGECRRLREELDCGLRIIQLIGENAWGESDTDYETLWSEAGLAAVAGYADGIGPWIRALYDLDTNEPRSNGRAERACALGLEVHPYTYRSDDLPEGFGDFGELLRFSRDALGVSAVFSDFPDRARRELY